MSFAETLSLALAAAIIDVCVGYPEAVSRRIGDPALWMSALIDGLEARLNRPNESFAARGAAGAFTLVFAIAAVGLAAGLIVRFAPPLPWRFPLLALVASTLISRQNLDRKVRDVASALETRGLAAGRTSVARIVEHDPDALDEAGVARAAIEGLAKNYADGVVAPLFWLALLGLPGAAIYTAIRTADILLASRHERHPAFGWAAARLNDLVALPASRLSALWLIAGAAIGGWRSARRAALTVTRDARRRRSPNDGYPEAAVAGALGLKLAGPRVHRREVVADAYVGDGRAAATAADIRRALGLFRRASAVEITALTALTLAAQAL